MDFQIIKSAFGIEVRGSNRVRTTIRDDKTMKTKLFCLVACMILWASCSEYENEWLDDQGFPKVMEETLLQDGVIVGELTKKFPSTWKEMEDDIQGDGKYESMLFL